MKVKTLKISLHSGKNGVNRVDKNNRKVLVLEHQFGSKYGGKVIVPA